MDFLEERAGTNLLLLQLDNVNHTCLYNWRLLAVDGVAVTRDDLLGFLPLGTKLSSVAASSASSNVLSAKEACNGTITCQSKKYEERLCE